MLSHRQWPSRPQTNFICSSKHHKWHIYRPLANQQSLIHQQSKISNRTATSALHKTIQGWEPVDRDNSRSMFELPELKSIASFLFSIEDNNLQNIAPLTWTILEWIVGKTPCVRRSLFNAILPENCHWIL